MDFLIECEGSKKSLRIENEINFGQFLNHIKQLFLINDDMDVIIQRYDESWDDWMDISFTPEERCKLKVVIKEKQNDRNTQSIIQKNAATEKDTADTHKDTSDEEPITAGNR